LDGRNKAIQLAHSLTRLAKAWYETLSLEEQKSYGLMKTLLTKTFKVDQTNLDTMYQMEARVQKEGESVDAYVFEKMIWFNRMGNVSDTEKMLHTIKGFLPDIRRAVVDGKSKSMTELITRAQAAERKRNILKICEINDKNREKEEDKTAKKEEEDKKRK
jgi:polysaccharide pyruvyl transferase WcaK-like protein